MDALDDLLSDPDFQKPNPEERKRKEQIHRKSLRDIKQAKLTQQQAVESRERRLQEHEATLAQPLWEDAAQAPTSQQQEHEADPCDSLTLGGRSGQEPARFNRILHPAQVPYPAAALDSCQSLMAEASTRAKEADIDCSSLQAELAQESITGGWASAGCLAERHCPKALATLLFQLVCQTERLDIALAAHQQLTTVIETSGAKASGKDSSKAGMQLQWVPDATTFFEAFAEVGGQEGEASQATQQTPATQAEPALANLQLLVQLLTTLCRMQAQTGETYFDADGLSHLAIFMLHISLDPSGLALSTDLEEAFEACIAAFDEEAWGKGLPAIAERIALAGASHAAAAGVIRHLLVHDPRMSQLRQLAASHLLCSLKFCQALDREARPDPQNVQEVIRSMPWFGIQAMDMMLDPLLRIIEDSDHPVEEDCTGLEPDFAKQLSRFLQHLDSTIHKIQAWSDHGARQCKSQAGGLRDRILSALTAQ
ncbi:hypothetical protein WJX73_007752 [Symbiochloris irregularis]|uniref:Uncharacterized protein n=1 Tax=Symbiochloris irregularis TaxID=706552 RepID=A0AAW1PKM9_9CHLO